MLARRPARVSIEFESGVVSHDIYLTLRAAAAESGGRHEPDFRE